MLLSLPLALLLAIESHAQTSVLLLSGSQSVSSLPFDGGDLLPSGSQVTYATYTATSTVPSGSLRGSVKLLSTTIAVANGSTISPSSSSNTSSTSSHSVTLLQGGQSAASTTSTINGTSNSTARSTTSSSAQPTNTQPCNNYPELCSRNYSNITYIAAHNSPFVNPNNAAANQDYGVIAQLNDGIRMLQGQTHSVNNTIYYCHSSCNLLNAGTAEAYFTNITTWVRAHPFDVVTLLIGNSDFRNVTDYVTPLQASGLSTYAYRPPKIPMAISDWPTLSSMILMQKRVVIFMDYKANQTEVPWILDQFSQLWETPFSPTNADFPCTQQRPPGLSQQDAKQRMYMANHNLNTEITALGASILIPSRALINQTNGLNGSGSLGAMADDCQGEITFPRFSESTYCIWCKLVFGTNEPSCRSQTAGDILQTSCSLITITVAATQALSSKSPHGIITSLTTDPAVVEVRPFLPPLPLLRASYC